MSDIIQLLPNAVANQIAAGEVIQRPASVVKELIENAIDAGASQVDIIIKDAGKTLIQVNDNGCGMSETDARMCFERHATSKISNANDLFAIRTLGFRGEAMASIASVSQLVLKTRVHDKETGTLVEINGSEVVSQEPVALQPGTQIMVRNLFYNIPARRKFLKTNTTEFRHITEEVIRAFMPNPDVKFKLYHNDEEVFNIDSGNIRQRISGLFGKNINQYLISIETETSLAKIKGYVGKPEKAKKSQAEQYFFVNGRYMQHFYFRRAVMMAYEQLIPQGSFPSFFIFFEVDPGEIDINIHPTKTEIKFENEKALFQILNAATKEALGKFSVVPPMDFSENETKDIHLTSKTTFNPPQVKIDPEYNPFENNKSSKSSGFNNTNKVPNNWKEVYGTPLDKSAKFDIENDSGNSQQDFFSNTQNNNDLFFQLKDKYILTAAKSGLMIIDQKRARERVVYEDVLSKMQTQQGITQKKLFPKQLEISTKERSLLLEMMEELVNIGFNISILGADSISINGVPAEFANDQPETLLENMLKIYEAEEGDLKIAFREKLTIAIAKAASQKFNRKLEQIEMKTLFFRLMSCPVHNYTPSGKKILEVITVEDLDKFLI
jgi:DNA mismatch repair protein MutL